MNKIFMTVLVAVIFFVSCNSSDNRASRQETTKQDQEKKYTELWGFAVNGVRNSKNMYDGLWRAYQRHQEDYGRSNYQIYYIYYNIKNNIWFKVYLFTGYNTFKNKYEWNLIFSAREEKESVSGYKSFGKGLTGIESGLPSNYAKGFGSISVIESDSWLRSYIEDEFEGVSTGYVVTTESSNIFPRQNKLQTSNIFAKQIPDPSLDQYISVDPIEGLWYLSADGSPASEEAFMDTKAIIVIGKDEKLNPGWYHVVLYYDSGDKEKGWICEWGAAEIAEKSLYVQLSSMSEGKPFTVTLNEKNGQKWLSLGHESKLLKGRQFKRILPLK